MSAQTEEAAIFAKIEKLEPHVASLLLERNACAKLKDELPKLFPGREASEGLTGGEVWDNAGLWLQMRKRTPEALEIHWQHYLNLLRAQQDSSDHVHKGIPLVRIADCYGAMGFPVHSKRYLMLTLCEDALGDIAPDEAGVYFRLVWGGLPDSDLERYGKQIQQFRGKPRDELPRFPEALLQGLTDDNWATEFPSVREASFYRANPFYVKHLIQNLGRGDGETLEVLAQYLMACMAGCRTRRRSRSSSTDYDVLCAMEGFDLDFRSELGRHFVCECKDWKVPADFSVMAKFCRVLDSTKSRFGILFSKEGITGWGENKYASLEQLKIFQDRGIIIVVLDLNDLNSVANGANLIALLRGRYEEVRLDLRREQRDEPQPSQPSRQHRGANEIAEHDR
jgi:hypothetical protein